MGQFKKQKGVTMIALVVTIVVMLIIASIMVATFSGKSGMVDKATDSQIMTELSQLQDTLNSKRAEGEGKRKHCPHFGISPSFSVHKVGYEEN